MGENLQRFPHLAGDDCVVHLPADRIEKGTTEKIEKILSEHNSISHVRIMPDCHPGHGCLVGFTAHVNALKINPNFIGGDIGCGILAYKLKSKKIDLEKVERKVRMLIPMGRETHQEPPIEESFLGRYLGKANERVIDFVDKFNEANKVKSLVAPTIDINFLENTCLKIGMKLRSCLVGLGTLGGGNHFIEIDADELTSEKYLSIHSGSRLFGTKLLHYYGGKCDKVEKCLVEEAALEYIYDMILAQELAIMNRHIMLHLILRELNIDFEESNLVESVHNYIDFDRMILRKGAIRAEENELCIVALNMRDGILLCRGLGNAEWNYSCAHGCGRLFSRGEARRHISLKEFTKSMREVVSTCVREDTIDEAPSAYKDVEGIVEAIEGNTVTIEKRLISLVNWKGGSEV